MPRRRQRPPASGVAVQGSRIRGQGSGFRVRSLFVRADAHLSTDLFEVAFGGLAKCTEQTVPNTHITNVLLLRRQWSSFNIRVPHILTTYCTTRGCQEISATVYGCGGADTLQGYLAHKKRPSP